MSKKENISLSQLEHREEMILEPSAISGESVVILWLVSA